MQDQIGKMKKVLSLLFFCHNTLVLRKTSHEGDSVTQTADQTEVHSIEK